MITPALHMSTFSSYPAPEMTSGATYVGVPHVVCMRRTVSRSSVLTGN